MANPQLITDLEYKALTARKITKATCEFYGYGIGDFKGQKVQVAPYYRGNKLAAQHLRFANKDFIFLGATGGIKLWGQQLWSPGGKRLIITEGEIDCLSIAQALGLKWPVVSLPNGAKSVAKALGDNIEYVNSFNEVVLAFDADKDGEEAIEAAALLIMPGKARVMRYPAECKDANDVLQKGQAQVLVQAVFQAEVYRPDGVIAGEDLFQDLLSDPSKGYSTPYPLMDSLTHGVRKGELYLFTAGSGIGKTTLVREIGYHFLTHHNLKIGVIALEESKKRTVEGFVGLHLNRPLHISRDGITLEDLEKAFKATVGSGRFYLYDHWGSTQLDNLMAKLRYMAIGLGVDFIVLDHISIVVSGLDDEAENERKLIDKLMTKLRSLIEETGVGVLAIVHLKRPSMGKSYNEGRQVSLSDLRGSGGLEQISDVVVAVERDQQGEHPDEAGIRVLKNRPIGKVGAADVLRYNHKTGRLLPGEAQFEDLSNQDF